MNQTTVRRGIPKADKSVFSQAARPGAVWLTHGFKGGGKTHAAVAIAQRMVEGWFPDLGTVVVVTNIIFLTRTAGRLTEGTPERVHHISTMKELFPIVVDSIERYGRGCLIMLILDEAQNFIGGDSNQTNASVMMKEFLGTIRKFRLMVWFLTPSAMSVGPSFRHYLNSQKYPGNVTAKFKKDLAANRIIVDAFDLDCRPEELILFQNYDMEQAMVVRIPVTAWTQRKEDIGEGEFCYDHEASATFHVGDGFDWRMFNRTVGGVSSIRVLDTIREFYARHVTEGDPGSKEVGAPKEYKLGVIRRAVSCGIDMKSASSMAGVPYSTARRWLREGTATDTRDAERARETRNDLVPLRDIYSGELDLYGIEHRCLDDSERCPYHAVV